MLRGRVTEACVPMVFTAAEACRFDWSDVFVMVDRRESLEMALDTHGQAFTFFGGAPAHMMDDPLKTVVDTICAGRQRRFNRRFVSCESRHRKRFLPLQSSKKSSLQSNGLQLCKLENLDANDWKSLRDVSHRSLYPARSLRSARSDWPVFGGHGCDANSQARRIKTSARPYFAGGPARACPRVYADDQRLQHGARNSVYGAGAQCQPVADAAPFTAFGQGLRERSL